MADGTCSESSCGSPVYLCGLCPRHFTIKFRRGLLPWVPSFEERFWAKIDRRSHDECRPWTWGTNKAGYGLSFVKPGEIDLERTGSQLAHRVAFRLVHGHWPEPFGLHGCDNPPCCNVVNPKHVHEGDGTDNAREMVGRDRQGPNLRSGEGHARASLTNEQVREIRARYAAGGVFLSDIAADYGVSRTCVSFIVKRKRYGAVI